MADDNTIYSSVYNVLPAFEGAATDYRASQRGLMDGEADNLAASEIRFLQNKSAYLCRNNGYAKTALNKNITNLGFVRTVWKMPNGKAHKVMQKYWDEFASNPSFDGHGDMKTFIEVANSSEFITGASYIQQLVVRSNNDHVVPLKLKLIPSILHDVTYNTMQPEAAPNEVTRYGITFRDSIPVIYHFRKSILEYSQMNGESYTNVHIPAEEIIHTFTRSEPGQWLGVPNLAPIILSLYELDDLMTATVHKQKVAQSIAVLIEQTGSTLSMLPIGPTKQVTDEEEKPKTIFKNNAKESQVIYLNKGEQAKMFQGADIGSHYGTLVHAELRKIAATLDLAYHELTGDTTGLNYSSIIGLAIASRNRLEHIHLFRNIPLREKRIADNFKKFAVLYNSKVANAVPHFQLPRWRGIDELKDAQADLLELQNGLGLYEDKLAERGLTVEQVLADREIVKQLEPFEIYFKSESSNDSMAQTGNTEANSNTTST